MYYVMKKATAKTAEPSVIEAGNKQKCQSYFDGYKDATFRYGDFKPSNIPYEERHEQVDLDFAHMRFIHPTEPCKSFDLYIIFRKV